MATPRNEADLFNEVVAKIEEHRLLRAGLEEAKANLERSAAELEAARGRLEEYQSEVAHLLEAATETLGEAEGAPAPKRRAARKKAPAAAAEKPVERPAKEAARSEAPETPEVPEAPAAEASEPPVEAPGPTAAHEPTPPAEEDGAVATLFDEWDIEAESTSPVDPSTSTQPTPADGPLPSADDFDNIPL